MRFRSEDSYQPGEKLFYHEDGEVDRVAVVSNNCDADWIKYELEVLEVVKKSRIFNPATPGEVFECSRRRVGGGIAGMWSLTED
ncbi:hypothetical protein DRN73_04585 [Candidatus Pacearchaeota archaeon]|nr:MAG: hypothetical protein DRN73_04585 [Candidatus Pacearchaeota archaeon]